MDFDIREYEVDNRSPFGEWFRNLPADAAGKVRTATARMSQGNFSNSKSLGDGVAEHKIHFGPGYRIYFGRDGQTVIILLGGGTKKNQSADIAKAKLRWQDYKHRKKMGEK